MSTFDLRDYQSDGLAQIRAAWAGGARNVLYVLPPGGGKTVIFGSELLAHKGASCAIAHRRELLGQMSVTLARLGVRHRIIAPDSVIREIVTLHVQATGRSYFDPSAPVGVASVDSLIRRELGSWAERVTLWVTDEAHHLLRKNKWGKALAMFPNARGLGVTGTPERADGHGLGRHADGLMDVMIVGPHGRALIDRGYLTDYKVYAPENDLRRELLPVSETTGEFAPKALVEATKHSHITGDLVEQYLRIAPGKLGVTFTVSVDLAVETAERYRAAGVPAEAVSAATPELVRAAILRRFARREILQLVNVDLFGEGFDLPAIEVVSDGAATQSYAKYAQRFGRMGRPMAGKPVGLYIDHVGNVLHHAVRRGMPDWYQEWTLDRREKRSRGSTEGPSPVRICPSCSGVYERVERACPYCGYILVPQRRTAPEHVDGDLLELDPAVLAQFRRDAARVMTPPHPPVGAAPVVVASIAKNHRMLVATQERLRHQIALWSGWQQHLGRDDSEGYRRFYRDFGIDVATAQTLRTTEAGVLAERIEQVLARAGVTEIGEAA